MENLTPAPVPELSRANHATRLPGGKWKPGTSGNPAGRPVGSGNPLKREIQAFLLAQTGEGRTRLAEQFEAMQARAEAGDAQATRLLWEYGFGKPAAAEEDREAMSGGSISALRKLAGLAD